VATARFRAPQPTPRSGLRRRRATPCGRPNATRCCKRWKGVHTQLYGLLTTWRLGGWMGGEQIGMKVPDLLSVGEQLEVVVSAEDPTLALIATVAFHDADEPVAEPKLLTNYGEGRYGTRFPGLPRGTYQVTVASAVRNRPIDPVSGISIVWEPEDA
jgi:hypothetical protein